MAKALDIALIIGVDHYADPRLPTCGAGANADAVEKWFYDSCDAIDSTPKVVSLRSGGGNTATTAAVFKAIGELCDQFTGPGSRLLFYFSGHGTIDENDRDILLCEDAGTSGSGILLDDVIKYCGRFRFDKQLFFVDACRVSDNFAGISIFQRFRNKPLPGVRYKPLVLRAQSTGSGFAAFADPALVVANKPGVPCAYFTTGLIHFAQSRPPHAAYCFIPELDAIGLRASDLQDLMQVHLAARKQSPTINAEGGNEPLHSPLLFERHPVEPGGWKQESLFPRDPDRTRYRRFMRAVLAELGGLDAHKHAIAAVENGGQKCGVFYLAPVDAPEANWLIRNVLFGEEQPAVDVHTIDLTAAGSEPTVEDFWERVEQAFGTRVTAALLQQLTGPTVLCIVLEDVRAVELTTEILAQFWTPLAAQCVGQSEPFYLVLIASDERARPAVAQAPGAQPIPPLAPSTPEQVVAWIERFRHELPLNVVKDRNVVAQKVAGRGPMLPTLVRDLCTELNVDALWMK